MDCLYYFYCINPIEREFFIPAGTLIAIKLLMPERRRVGPVGQEQILNIHTCRTYQGIFTNITYTAKYLQCQLQIN